ncbi:MAG: hypothetical protein KatS3mg052_1535 [Candidatus Roseilinea sp.]|nr:MAG: hypothetical protein KatS3mg052_1535 [Candidatus Roseilinea sp.]
MYHFNLRAPIPAITVPLQRGEDEPTLDLNAVLHDLYVRARYDLMLDYNQPPVPPLNDADAAWARELESPTLSVRKADDRSHSSLQARERSVASHRM